VSKSNSLGGSPNVLTFDALRGYQAGREFYVAMVELKWIPKLFVFNQELVPVQMRAQRILRESRIPEIANYMINNPKNYVFSSLTASVDGKVRFIPAPSYDELKENIGTIGTLHIPLGCNILINDGQHRRAAIEEALKHKPELGNEYISVVFFEDRGLKQSQQMFADLNKHAVKPTKSLGILYDHRDTFGQFIVKLANALPIFHGRVELERTSISNRSTKFFTLNGISDATKFLLRPKSKNLTEDEQKIAAEFWDEVSKNIPEWQLLIEKKVSAFELRVDYVHSHTNFINALGLVGHVLVTQYASSWKEKLKALQKIDWARDSPVWQGKLMLDGKMLKTKNGIKKAASVILHECGITKTLDEFEVK